MYVPFNSEETRVWPPSQGDTMAKSGLMRWANVLQILNDITNNDSVTDSYARCCRKRGQYISQPRSTKMENELAYNLIAEGELLRWNDTNWQPFVSFFYKFFLVMLNAAVRKVAVLQMNVGLGLDKSIGHYH